MSPTIAVLALQGAFIEHGSACNPSAAPPSSCARAADLARPFDGLVPRRRVHYRRSCCMTWESETAALTHRRGPALGTCAGLILLADHFAPCPSPCAATPTAANSAASTPRVAGKKGRRGQKKPREQPASQTRRTTSSISATLSLRAGPSPSVRAPRIEVTWPGVEPLTLERRTGSRAPIATRDRRRLPTPELRRRHPNRPLKRSRL